MVSAPLQVTRKPWCNERSYTTHNPKEYQQRLWCILLLPHPQKSCQQTSYCYYDQIGYFVFTTERQWFVFLTRSNCLFIFRRNYEECPKTWISVCKLEIIGKESSAIFFVYFKTITIIFIFNLNFCFQLLLLMAPNQMFHDHDSSRGILAWCPGLKLSI